MTNPEIALELRYFNSHPERILILAPTLLVLTLLTVSLRLYVRLKIMKVFQIDDWLLLGTVMVHIASTAVYISLSMTELDHGIVQVAGKIRQYIYAGECLYLGEQILLKAALAVYFLRIVTKIWQRWIIRVTILFYELYTVTFLLCAIFAYGLPTIQNLELGAEAKHAINYKAILTITYINAALNILADFIFTLLPVFVVVGAMLPIRTKISVSVLILLATIGSLISVGRIPLLPIVLPAHGQSTNFSAFEGLGCVSLGETAAGIMAISLATVRPLLSGWMDRAKSSKTSRTDRATNLNGGISRCVEYTVNKEVANEGWKSGSEDGLPMIEEKEPRVSEGTVA